MLIKKFVLLLLGMASITAYSQNFTPSEKAIILSGDTSSKLRIIPLTEPQGEKALRAISTDIDFADPLLSLLKNRMLKTVMDSTNRGVGIAAPQVGINRNLIWVQRFDKPGIPFEFFINPKIVWRSSLLMEGLEGDLSFEGRGNVKRNFSIMISYLNGNGNQQIEMLEDFTAVIFQHETDHLFGTLFTDQIKKQRLKVFEPFNSIRGSNFFKEKQE